MQPDRADVGSGATTVNIVARRLIVSAHSTGRRDDPDFHLDAAATPFCSIRRET